MRGVEDFAVGAQVQQRFVGGAPGEGFVGGGGVDAPEGCGGLLPVLPVRLCGGHVATVARQAAADVGEQRHHERRQAVGGGEGAFGQVREAFG